MKYGHIVRRVDDLGRIVIPKEIRQELNIKDGCPMTLSVKDDGSIVIKKYDNDSIERCLNVIENELDEYELNDNNKNLIKDNLQSIRNIIK